MPTPIPHDAPPPGPPWLVRIRTEDAAAAASAAIGVARLLAHLPAEWNPRFAVADHTVELLLNASDETAADSAVRQALEDPALEAWVLEP